MCKTQRILNVAAFMVFVLLVACTNSKLAQVKMTMGLWAVAEAAAREGVNVVVRERYNACLKESTDTHLGLRDEAKFQACMKDVIKMLKITEKLWPQLAELRKTALAAIKAYEQKTEGRSVDYVTPIRQAVCLLTTLRTWLPDRWMAKVDVFLSLASEYACTDSSSVKKPSKEVMVALVNAIDSLKVK